MASIKVTDAVSDEDTLNAWGTVKEFNFQGGSSLCLLEIGEDYDVSENVLLHDEDGVFRDPVADATALRYWRFHHEIIGDAIVYFAKKAQEVLQHRKLLGLFYGYLTQLNSERLLQEGHLGYDRVWSCPDIDMIYAPAKYGAPRSFVGSSGGSARDRILRKALRLT
jgi:hypothetical protein